MEKVKKILHHFFIPSDKNNYRSHAVSHNFLTSYLILAFLVVFAFKKTSLFKNVLGFATDITVEKLLQLTNAQREKNGLKALKYNARLSQAAADKARDMFDKNYWAHYAPDGKTPWDFILNSGYQYEYAGENLAKNFLFSQAVVDAWMASASHKENILRNTYSDVGFAIVNGVLNGEETTLVVQMFGSPSVNAAPAAAAPKQPSVLSKSTSDIVENLEFKKNPVKPTLSLFNFTFSASYAFILFLILALAIDFYFATKLNVVRIHGKNLAHLIFLLFLVVSISLVIAKSGAVL